MVQVTAVVLTYNRQELMKRCLHALIVQTRPCDRIIVVDNASIDGTAEMLKAFASDRLQVRTLPTNIGAAGGFSLGMKLGRETKADYVWVMDDDVIAAPDALAELLTAWKVLDARAIHAPYVLSSARFPDGLMTSVPEIDRHQNRHGYENWPDLLAFGMVPVSRSTFVSILIPRATFDRYGLPLAEMFIWGEDSEYTLRITREQPGYMVGRSQVAHVRALSGVLDIRTENDPVRIGWHCLRTRNDIYIRRRYHGRLETGRHILRVGQQAAQFALTGQLHKSRALLKGILLGLAFRPEAGPSPSPPAGQVALEGARDGGAGDREQLG